MAVLTDNERALVRLYEMFSIGTVPVYIFDDEWLPYRRIEDLKGQLVVVKHTAESAQAAAHRLQNRVDNLEKNLSALCTEVSAMVGILNKLARTE